MNKIIIKTLLVLCVVASICWFIDLFILSNITNVIEQKKANLKTIEKDIEILEISSALIATESQKMGEDFILNIGQEGQLMSWIINKDSQKYFKVCSYDLYSSYQYKPEDSSSENDLMAKSNESESFGGNDSGINENLQNLDSNGMPIGAYSDDEDDSWEGLSVVPVKITFSTKQDHLPFILKSFQRFPVNTVRLADFIYSENDDKVNGTLVLAFPLNEESN